MANAIARRVHGQAGAVKSAGSPPQEARQTPCLGAGKSFAKLVTLTNRTLLLSVGRRAVGSNGSKQPNLRTDQLIDLLRNVRVLP